MKSFKVLIATGGTGGHLFPSQQLGEQLNDCELIFAGHKLRNSRFFNKKYPFVEIASASSKKNVFTLLKGVLQSFKLIWHFSPDIVVGFGSFHSFPVLMAAVLLRKKIILFEANCSLGKVNRFFAPFAKKIAFQFPVRHKNCAYVPLLPWSQPKCNKREKSVKDSNFKTILVFGGSQGAAFINKTFCDAARLLSFSFQVIHLTGKDDPEIKYSVPALIKPFEEDMESLYLKTDFAVCRCGAGTTAELIRYQIPAVVIPYPFANNHQRKNGEFLGKGVRLIDQKKLTAEMLAMEIELLNQNLEEHRKALSKIVFPETIQMESLVRLEGLRRV